MDVFFVRRNPPLLSVFSQTEVWAEIGKGIQPAYLFSFDIELSPLRTELDPALSPHPKGGRRMISTGREKNLPDNI